MSNALQYAAIVSDKATQRRLIKAAAISAQGLLCAEGDVNDLLEMAEKTIFDISQGRNSKSYARISDILPQVYEEISELSQGKDVSGIPTGFFGS